MADRALNDRQTKILVALKDGGLPVQDIAAKTGLGDARGVAQTIRRMRDLVDRTETGYEMSFAGIQVAKGL